MTGERMQHCFNCGAEIGVYRSYPGDLDTCGARECEREARYQRQAESDDRYARAQEDDFQRYSGGW